MQRGIKHGRENSQTSMAVSRAWPKAQEKTVSEAMRDLEAQACDWLWGNHTQAVKQGKQIGLVMRSSLLCPDIYWESVSDTGDNGSFMPVFSSSEKGAQGWQAMTPHHILRHILKGKWIPVSWAVHPDGQ